MAGANCNYCDEYEVGCWGNQVSPPFWDISFPHWPCVCRPNILELDTLLTELSLCSARTELYFTFLARKIGVSVGWLPIEGNFCMCVYVYVYVYVYVVCRWWWLVCKWWWCAGGGGGDMQVMVVVCRVQVVVTVVVIVVVMVVVGVCRWWWWCAGDGSGSVQVVGSVMMVGMKWHVEVFINPLKWMRSNAGG